MGDFGEDSEDSDGEGGMGNVNRIIMRPVGHSGKAKRGHLCFDASFETGNLGRVDLVSEYEYDLFIRPDTCSPRLRFWFNFTVDNVKQDQKVVFNIVNISKGRNLFMHQMTPLVKSSSRLKWQRIPKKFVFYHKSPVHNGHYVLSFCFGFDKEDDIFQFALAPPYSYSKLQTFLNNLEKKSTYLHDCFSREMLITTVQKRKLDLLTIGSVERIKGHKSRVVVIMARVHPGESPASFVCQGLLELLVSSNAVAKILRQNVVFKIIPMLNPDGVFLGNYRSNVVGADLNRSWHIANSWCHPTIKAVIETLISIEKHKEFQLDFVIDIHAHSSLKGCFIYGNTYDDVYRYERHILFPKLLGSITDDYSSENTMFNSDSLKLGTARRYFCSLLNDKVNCYTFEVSIFGYTPKGSDLVIPYTEESYMRCGRNLVRTFLEYYQNIGAIPVEVSKEIVPKRQRARSHKFHRKKIKKPFKSLTSRIQAQVHFTNLNMNYDSETSNDDFCYSFRQHTNLQKAFDGISERYYLKKTPGEVEDVENYTSTSPPVPSLLVMPEPTLSIIDFNIMSRCGLEKAQRKH